MKLYILSTAVVTTTFIYQSYALPFDQAEEEFSYTRKLLSEINAQEAVKQASPLINILSWDESYAKAKMLVDQMSLEQKVNITTGIGWQTGPCVGNNGRTTSPDFPELCLQDSPLGMRFADGVSSGVAGINAAASFDRAAIRRRGEYMGEEFRAKGAHIQLGPSMNMLRAPEAGRNWEAFGEDPFLVGVASAETITGIQSQGVMAVAKHLIGNEQETNRLVHSANIDERTIQEVYLWPFARSIEAGVASVMCAYNKINGVYACESDYAINKLLKGQLGFKGFVQSDWSATHSTVDSANNGLDMTMPGDISFHSGDSYFGKNLTDAVQAGRVQEDRVTDMVMRIVASWYKLGQDQNFPNTNFHSFRPELDKHIDVQSDHKNIIREMGAASTILLKNLENILPLRTSGIKKMAIIGSDATTNQLGLECEDHGCTSGSIASGWGSGTSRYPYLVSPLDGISARAGNIIDISEHLRDDDLPVAAELASKANIAIVCVNANSGEEYITVEGHKGDRNHLDLWHNGNELIKAVADANENTIVVIHSVGPILMPWSNHPNIKAIVLPGLPGQESGNSLADILFGDVNPSGRLPYTIAKRKEDYPAKIDHGMSFEYSEGINIGYRWFDKHGIEPLYEFGYGLSYTSFEYRDININLNQGTANDNVDVQASVTIANTGMVDGAEVPQAYITFPEIADEPPKLLRGFEKIFLSKGGEQVVNFSFRKTELSYYSVEFHQWIVPQGEFKVHIGSSSRNIRGSAAFTLS